MAAFAALELLTLPEAYAMTQDLDDPWLNAARLAQDHRPIDRGIFWAPLDELYVWPLRVIELLSRGERRVVAVSYTLELAPLIELHPAEWLDERLGGEPGRTRALSAGVGLDPWYEDERAAGE